MARRGSVVSSSSQPGQLGLMLDGLTTPRSVGGLSPRDRNIATTTSGLLAHANPAAGARVKKSHVRIRMSASGLRSLDAAQQPDQEEEQDERKHNEQDKSGAPAPPPGGKFMELFRCREAAWQRIVTTEARVEDEPSWDAVVLRKRRLQSNEDDKAVQSPLLLRCWCLEAKAGAQPELLGEFVTTLDALMGASGKTFDLSKQGTTTGSVHFREVKRTHGPNGHAGATLKDSMSMSYAGSSSGVTTPPWAPVIMAPEPNTAVPSV